MRQLYFVRVFVANPETPDNGVSHDIYVEEADVPHFVTAVQERGFRFEIHHVAGWISLTAALEYLSDVQPPPPSELAAA